MKARHREINVPDKYCKFRTIFYLKLFWKYVTINEKKTEFADQV